MLLSMKNIDKSFFGKMANQQVCLTVETGEIHALLGENGAGKTTLMNILYGIYQKDAGEILWKGSPVELHSPKDAIRLKIGMVHQHFTLVPTLTVSQNITLGLHEKGYPFTDRKALDQRILDISAQYGLEIHPEARVSTLSVGEQQRVEIMKLLYRDAQLLILDEPTAVLTPQETHDFFQVLKKLKADGRSVILITHRIPEVMAIADCVTVLRDTYSILSAPIGTLTEKSLSEHMIGRELKQMHRPGAATAEGQEGLSLTRVSLRENGLQKLSDLNLRIAPGEILGIAGVDGNGQKELAEVILGIRRVTEGQLSLAGVELTALPVHRRKQLGIGYISDDRHHDGLVMDMSLVENLLLQDDKNQDFVKNGFVRWPAVRQKVGELVAEYDIKTHTLDTAIRYLSGGNQQKLILARELFDGVKLIIAFQPTRGLDIGASEFIREQLAATCQKGCCVLLISADLEEILSLSNRIAVLHKGSIMGVLPNSETLDMTRIGLMMAGRTAEMLDGEVTQ
ncbi:MAG: ABC transporter ATP-binding protein [Oscillospiraceae bacterium]